MGTEILHPQDILNERLRSVHTISPRQRQSPFTNPRSWRKPAAKPETKKRPSKQDRIPNPDANPGKNLVMGQVTILKRGQSLDLKRSHEFNRRNDLKKSVSLTESDLIVCGTERLGPDPELVPKQIAVLSPSLFRSNGVYAGSAFSQSPPPSSLPLPKFSKRKEGAATAIDDSATKDLRRLLRLE
ncbi:uncharacterized protein LOC131225396 [Magnolia sinica]|uniref:uncharacterized protein LOC131225396 n=1 Tax=Magnolia sinica TaxID=86752 RepID=UPI00265A6619|nr:uncharacterized protein LOC131225396 [Magnolia sinica]